MDICPPVAILPGQNSTYTSVRITETTSERDHLWVSARHCNSQRRNSYSRRGIDIGFVLQQCRDRLRLARRRRQDQPIRWTLRPSEACRDEGIDGLGSTRSD
jgi:hypothetical protein